MQYTRRSPLLLSLLFVFAFGAISVFAQDLPKPLENLVMLDGYAHKALQGIDSQVGEIAKEGGLSLQYEIGRITPPGGFATGGDYHNMAAGTGADFARWKKVQKIGSEEIHLTYKKDGFVIGSFPSRGVNMYGKVSSTEQFSEALLMMITVPVVGE